jgi:hypothetical protein
MGPTDSLSIPIATLNDTDWSAMFMDLDMGSFVDAQGHGALL